MLYPLPLPLRMTRADGQTSTQADEHTNVAVAVADTQWQTSGLADEHTRVADAVAVADAPPLTARKGDGRQQHKQQRQQQQ